MAAQPNWVNKIILFVAVLVFLPSIINAFRCYRVNGYLDLLSSPCDCLYDQTGGYFIFNNSYFNNLTDSDIEANAVYVNQYVRYERLCELRYDHRLYCPFVAKETGIPHKKNVTVTIKSKRDSSVKMTTFSINAFVRNCICDDDIAPTISLKQTSWNSLRLTWDKPDYTNDFFTHSVYFVMKNGKQHKRNGDLKSSFDLDYLKPKRFKDQIKVCVTSDSLGLCSSVKDVCQNITMSSFFYFKHFAFDDKDGSCRVTDDDVQLKWSAKNIDDMKDLGFEFRIGMFDEEGEILKTISAMDTSWNQVMSEAFREQLHYVEVSLCLAPNKCGKKLIVKCDKPLTLSMSYLIYVGIGLILAVIFGIVFYKGFLQSCMHRPTVRETNTGPVEDYQITPSSITISQQYEEIKVNSFPEEHFDSLDVGCRVTNA